MMGSINWHKLLIFFHSFFFFRFFWDPTLECLVGCRAWCPLHLAKYERKEGSTQGKDLLILLQQGCSQGEAGRPGRRAENCRIKKLNEEGENWQRVFNESELKGEDPKHQPLFSHCLSFVPTSCRDWVSWSTASVLFFPLKYTLISAWALQTRQI